MPICSRLPTYTYLGVVLSTSFGFTRWETDHFTPWCGDQTRAVYINLYTKPSSQLMVQYELILFYLFLFFFYYYFYFIFIYFFFYFFFYFFIYLFILFVCLFVCLFFVSFSVCLFVCQCKEACPCNECPLNPHFYRRLVEAVLTCTHNLCLCKN